MYTLSQKSRKMATTQKQRDESYRERQHALGFAKICVMFPAEYRQHLNKYVERKRKKWEKERDGK